MQIATTTCNTSELGLAVQNSGLVIYEKNDSNWVYKEDNTINDGESSSPVNQWFINQKECTTEINDYISILYIPIFLILFFMIILIMLKIFNFKNHWKY